MRLVIGSTVAALVASGCAGPVRPPVVGIDGPARVAIEPGAPVRLTAVSTDPEGGEVALRWDLGDGTTAEGGAVEHRYGEPGGYWVVLSGAGRGGAPATPAEVLVEVGDVPPAPADHALRFGGTGRADEDRVKILLDDPAGRRAFGADVGATDMTIEFWLRARPGENAAGPVDCSAGDAWIRGNIVLDRDRFGEGRKFGLSLAAGRVVFGVTGSDGAGAAVCGVVRVDDDRWHHVAVTRDAAGGTVQLFVDGRPDGQAQGPPGDVSYPDGATPAAKCADDVPCTRSDPYLVIGAEKHDAGSEYPSFTGFVDDLRLSTTVRYRGPFAAPRALTADAETAALYRFDEGRGTVARDSSKHPDPSHGRLVVGPGGPRWMPSDRRTG